MDEYLVRYLKSGKAWVLVGSGPSSAMHYPTWKQLAEVSLKIVKQECIECSTRDLERAIKRRDYPYAFDEAAKVLGMPRLLQALQETLKPLEPNAIYEYIVKWPVPVFLTTNYDDEIQTHLSKIKVAYQSYTNSEDHFAYLEPDLDGAIFKLHGDLRSEKGLILTSTHYKNILDAGEWEYWRIKMTSIFQMQRVIVIGHSLTDGNIRHVLETAKKGSGVQHPVCWIAPDVDYRIAREYLEKYRIRVISYPNQEGDHRYLLPLIRNISNYIPSRVSISISSNIKDIVESSQKGHLAAAGFYIFNKLSPVIDFERKRVEIICAAIQSVIPVLQTKGTFSLEESLELIGWPANYSIDPNFARAVRENIVSMGLLQEGSDGKLFVSAQAEKLSATNKKAFEHSRALFITSLKLRLKKTYTSLQDSDIDEIASYIESSLVGFFNKGGLSLASTLFSTEQLESKKMPSSVLQFVVEASLHFTDSIKRQAFTTIATDIYVDPEKPEKDYLGRISHGYMAFHMLGVFGEYAWEKLNKAKNTVWLIDSNVQIHALALGSPTNFAFESCFKRLKEAGVRLFTPRGIFEEAYSHFRFADELIREKGPDSANVINAAKGQLPYRKSNDFIVGFINWRAAGNPSDWKAYLYQIFEDHNPTEETFKSSLRKLGIEVVSFEEWPGYSEDKLFDLEKCSEDIVKLRDEVTSNVATPVDSDTEYLFEMDSYRKAKPEAEALIIVRYERDGKLRIISEKDMSSDAWFITQSSFLNNATICAGKSLTWKPDAFLSFASHLPSSIGVTTDEAFGMIVLKIAEAGFNTLPEKTIDAVFGGIIDQAELNIKEQSELYNSTIAEKYGRSLENVIQSVAPSDRPLAALQLANEMAQKQSERVLAVEKVLSEKDKKIKSLEQIIKVKSGAKTRKNRKGGLPKSKQEKNKEKRKKRKKRKRMLK